MKNKEIAAVLLERVYLEELPEKRKKELKQLISKNETEKNKLKDIHKSNQDFFEKFPVSKQVLKIKEKYFEEELKQEEAQWQKNSRKNWVLGLGGALALAITLFLFVPVQKTIHFFTPIEETREKGLKPYLSVYRKNGNEVEILKNNDKVKAGDLIQLGYVSKAKEYGMIFSIDGNKTVTLHYPEKIQKVPVLENQEKEVLLPNSYQLDDAPYFENFYFITSSHPLPVVVILEAAEKLAGKLKENPDAKLILPDTMEQFVFTVVKGE